MALRMAHLQLVVYLGAALIITIVGFVGALLLSGEGNPDWRNWMIAFGVGIGMLAGVVSGWQAAHAKGYVE